MKTANCLCGRVSITVPELQTEVGACHCSMCRRWGAGPLLTVEAGTGEEISIQPESLVTRYPSSEWAERGFCSVCGTHLFYHLLANDAYSVPIDLFTEQTGAKLTLEIYYDQKPEYYRFANEIQKLTEAEIMKMVQAQYFNDEQ